MIGLKSSTRTREQNQSTETRGVDRLWYSRPANVLVIAVGEVARRRVALVRNSGFRSDPRRTPMKPRPATPSATPVISPTPRCAAQERRRIGEVTMSGGAWRVY